MPRPDAGSSDNAGGGFNFGSFPWSAFGFGGNAKNEEEANKFSNDQFGGVFEEMLRCVLTASYSSSLFATDKRYREEGMAEKDNTPTGKFWGIVGAVSGGAMGFIIANAPGAIAGAVAGNRLGAVRDTKGKSVYSVFQELDQPAKMRLLGELAQKVFAHAIS